MTETTLTSILIELFKYFGEETKAFVDKSFQEKIKDYVADLGKTKDELKNLIAALDELDFKDDGTIDIKALMAKVAANEAAVAEIKQILEDIKKDISDNKTQIQEVKTDLENKINEISKTIENLTVQSGAINPQDFEDLKARVDDIEKNLEIDVEVIKKAISF